MVAARLIPLLLSWAGIVLVLLRGFPGRRSIVAITGSVGCAVGLAGAYILFRTFPAEISFGIVRDAAGWSLLFLWAISVAAFYRSAVQNYPLKWGERFTYTPLFAAGCSFPAGMLAGAICACRVLGTDRNALVLIFILLGLTVVAFLVLFAEKLLPASFTVTRAGQLAAVVALLLFSSSYIIRLDLFLLSQ